MTSQSVTSTLEVFRRQRDSVTQLLAIIACYMISNIIYKAHARGLIESPWFSYLCYIHHISNFGVYVAANSEFRNEMKRLVKNRLMNIPRLRSYVQEEKA